MKCKNNRYLANQKYEPGLTPGTLHPPSHIFLASLPPHSPNFFILRQLISSRHLLQIFILFPKEVGIWERVSPSPDPPICWLDVSVACSITFAAQILPSFYQECCMTMQSVPKIYWWHAKTIVLFAILRGCYKMRLSSKEVNLCLLFHI
jgi:hypothetical protein